MERDKAAVAARRPIERGISEQSRRRARGAGQETLAFLGRERSQRHLEQLPDDPERQLVFELGAASAADLEVETTGVLGQRGHEGALARAGGARR